MALTIPAFEGDPNCPEASAVPPSSSETVPVGTPAAGGTTLTTAEQRLRDPTTYTICRPVVLHGALVVVAPWLTTWFTTALLACQPGSGT